MVRFVALDTASVRKLQNGGLDANGQPCEQATSTGAGTPCRHCLRHIEEGDKYLILSFRPFSTLQPYSEQGPIFLHAKECERHESGRDLPPILDSAQYIVRGYDSSDRIMYGTGKVTQKNLISDYAEELFADPSVAYLHVRSAANNCYQCRIDKE